MGAQATGANAADERAGCAKGREPAHLVCAAREHAEVVEGGRAGGGVAREILACASREGGGSNSTCKGSSWLLYLA